MTDKPKRRQAPSAATKKPRELSSLTPVARRFRQLKPLSIEEQKALGLDTGPVLIVSTAPVRKRGTSPSPSSEPLEMTQITPEEAAADKRLPEKPAEESGVEKED